MWSSRACYPAERRLLMDDLSTERAHEARSPNRGERRLAILDGLERALTDTNDLDALFAPVARLFVPDVADWCFIETLEDDGWLRRRVYAEPEALALAGPLARRYRLAADLDIRALGTVACATPRSVRRRLVLESEDLPRVLTLDVASVLSAPLRWR